ncbi:sugar efflux transporter [Lederbergia sp. NSJ-179]|uniref:sugar efflux transporter n=1 Tax=Lederbergia sp. NSJ-179 TaxID=2931402 RepID=UPI001FD30766|nr:sugar efflux transporter [Lederbergia sp. NSJ-179]MCJ7843203.1 sugar efflux transporter [Lederbergia sp. NSJ-179]
MFSRFKQLFQIKHFGLFIICMLLIGTSVSITMPYLSIYGTSVIGMSTGAFGVFMAISSLTGVIANTMIANYSDNGMDRKWLILAAMFSSACGYSSYLLFDSFLGLLLSVSFFNGLGAAAMPQMFAYAHELATESQSDDKTFAKSTLRSLFSLGFLIGPLIGTVLLAAFGYNGLFLGTTTIFILLSALVYFFLPKRKMANTPKPKVQKPTLFSVETKRLFLPFFAFILLFSVVAVNSMNTPLLIIHELNGTHADVGLMVGLCAGLEIPIMLTFGALSKKLSNQTIVIMSCLVGILYFTVLGIATASWQLIAAQILQATFIAVVTGNGLSYFSDFLPDSAGVAATLYANASTLGRLGGNLMGGFGAELAGFRYVNWLCVSVIFISFIVLFVKPAKPMEKMEEPRQMGMT